MLVMNELFQHVWRRGLSQSVFDEVKEHYPDSVATFDGVHDMVLCHLLLAALYQDTGELPFQKVSSLYFVPVEGDVNLLVNAFPKANPREWSSKNVFSVLSLLNDSHDAELKDGFAGYDLEFIVYLITGYGASAGTKAIGALLQMLDGEIDADPAGLRLSRCSRNDWKFEPPKHRFGKYCGLRTRTRHRQRLKTCY